MTHNITRLHTPYHELGGDAPRVPSWAGHRSVYRSAGRTLYLVETDSLDAARSDLDALSQRGWEVQIDRDRKFGHGAKAAAASRAAGTIDSVGAGGAASIALSRKAA